MIELMKKNETDEVMGIWLTSVILSHPFISEVYWRDHYDAVKDEYLPAAQTYVYKEKNKVLGFVSIIGNGYIGALFVEAGHQGQGIGKCLLDYCQRRYDHLDLAVYVENNRAVTFYQRCGFYVQKEMVNESSGQKEYQLMWRK